MIHFKIFRKFLLPGRSGAGVICAAAALTAEEEKCGISKAIEEASKTDSCKRCQSPPPSSKLRPSELPIYAVELERTKRMEKVEEPLGLEKMISAVRKELWSYYDQYKEYQHKVADVVETGKAHSETTLSFLREEATTVHRAGAIGLGGLAGVIMGLRGGWFKRIVYGATGATAMAAICYPRESSEIADQSLQMAKYYFTIAYNFIYGVKPDGFKFLSPPTTVDNNKPSTKGSTPPVPDQIILPVAKEESSPVPQVEEIPKITKIPSLKVTSEEYISEAYGSVSTSCTCPDPVSGYEVRYPSYHDELDKLGEMMSDVVYWGFRFVSQSSHNGR